MGYTYDFMDNATYGADDLNRAMSRFVTSGIADAFEDNVSYNTSKLCEVTQRLYAPGVVPEHISTLKVSRVSDSEIYIAPGLAFFENGSTITVDSEGVRLSYLAGEKNYVYLKADPANNRNLPMCTTEPPTGDIVMLAQIEPDGAVTDKRTYAKGKVPGYASDFNQCKRMTFSHFLPKSEHGTGTKTTVFVEDVGLERVKFVFFTGIHGNTLTSQGITYSWVLFDAETQKMYFNGYDSSLWAYVYSTNPLAHNAYQIQLRLSSDGGALTFTYTNTDAYKDHEQTITLYVA